MPTTAFVRFPKPRKIEAPLFSISSVSDTSSTTCWPSYLYLSGQADERKTATDCDIDPGVDRPQLMLCIVAIELVC